MATSTTVYAMETNTGTITTWLPLPTPFLVTQKGCSTSFRDVNYGMNAFDPNYSSLDPHYACMPAAASNWWNQPFSPEPTQTTILGIGPMVCPESWNVVQTSTKDMSSVFSMCCPV
jgi:hypothetical protein